MDSSSSVLPQHIAIIMDGNGRWARAKGQPRSLGHRQGAETLRKIATACQDLNIPYVSVFAFSTENWKRSSEEVGFLMKLLQDSIANEVQKFSKKTALRIRFLGRIQELNPDLQNAIRRAEEISLNTPGTQLNILLNYGSRAEIVDAVNAARRSIPENQPVTEADIASHLYTAGIPDPDLLIRTSGEFRLSNFLLWQMAYTELWVTPKYWPDFEKSDLLDAITAYQSRQRRFGVES
jgi:undecaprenyl diphosphate synthase